MTVNAVDLLIKSKPLWHQAAANDVPVTVMHAYSVLGRRGQKWESILSSTDDMHVARRTMEAANSAGVFDRIVITKGNSVNGAPAGKWETIECALPQHRVVTGDSFTTLLHKLQTQTANINPEGLYQHAPVRIVGEKESPNLVLFCAMVLAGLSMNAPVLIIIAAIALIEMVFMADKQPIAAETLKRFTTFRRWFYALLNGALLVQLLFF